MVIQSPPKGPGPGTGSATGSAVPSARQVAGRRWRSARGVVAVLLAMVLIAVVLAALRPSGSPEELDPTSPKRDGTRALAEILKQRGTPVTVSRRAGQAAAASTPGSVLVVTRSERLTTDDLDRLRTVQGDLLLVSPGRDVMQALAPGVRSDGPSFEKTAEPGCTLHAATLAGGVTFGNSQTYEAPAGATSCYKAGNGGEAGEAARLVQIQTGGRTITVLGSSGFLTNEHLAENGNAALAMNLAGARSSVVWLIPDQPASGADTGDTSLAELVPFGVWLFFLELVVAVLLVAAWRARRLGPVVAEALPVAVRSAETVEGRARLYRARRARDRASDALRSGARERIVPLLGLPRSSAQDPAAAQEIVTAVALRTTHEEAYVGAALYGPEPADDAGLIALSGVLDDLERQVRQS
ncbi:DUF4350 domain-containing protein [Actinomadura macra]|uniref:DUF4350 domain-containing protein n=1 Tax=Actinomadura macra TaxID=46164 RepID=UPI00083092C5|nr:DUF4350 domain-containing protein [Actinomadura macra]